MTNNDTQYGMSQIIVECRYAECRGATTGNELYRTEGEVSLGDTSITWSGTRPDRTPGQWVIGGGETGEVQSTTI